MYLKILIMLSLLLVANVSAEDEVTAVEREMWTFTDTNTTETGQPSSMKYFKYYDSLPDEISLETFKNMDLSGFEGKNIVIGYGITDPTGDNCKVYPPSITGKSEPITICLPWWRVERTYQKEFKSVNDLNNFFKYMPKPRPPILVNYCKEWESGATYAGGMVSCTTYYDKLVSSECWANPMQQRCFVDNCGLSLRENCAFQGMALSTEGHDKLKWAIAQEDGKTVNELDVKIQVRTKQYKCPAGKIVKHTACKEEVSSLMFTYQCTPDNPNTAKDDGVYIYCDKDKPTYDGGGDIIGFTGRCPDGRQVICDTDTISEEKRVCKEPIMGISTEERDESVQVGKTYDTFSISVISGEPDIYSEDPNCLRANTIEEAREGVFQARVKGSGYLDDDIFVLTHSNDGTLGKIYCNQQHNGSNPYKVVGGNNLHCIPNSGSYSFNKTVDIVASHVVSVQQASEIEIRTGSWFAGRNHYRSTQLTIEGVLVAPTTSGSTFPYYPANGPYVRTWDNSLSTLSLMFPFSGAYELYFYDNSGREMGSAIIDSTDFEEMGAFGNTQLKLGKEMDIIVNESSSCKEDEWAEWGGGVYGGKASKTGGACSSPSDSHVKGHPVTRIIVKDLLTGMVTNIPLVYPLPYPNRVFVSKLKLQEKRIYRCYKPFPLAAPKN